MSLIHEALKKAEAQRRLGEPPTLGTPFGQTRARRSLLPVLSALIAVALGAGWWMSSRQPPDDAPTVAAESKSAPAAAAPRESAQESTAKQPRASGTAASTAAERRPVGSPESATAKTVGSLVPVPGPINQAPPPHLETVRDAAERESEPHPAGTNPLAPGEAAPIALGKAAPETPPDPAGQAAKDAAKAGKTTTLPIPPPPNAMAAAPPPTPNNATTKAGTAPPPAPPANTAAAPPTSVAKAPPAPAPAEAAATPQAPPPLAPVAPPENLPLYWQLPLNIRKDLPALKLSMHVYSPTPTQRFIILNGTRQVEGDDLGADVKLTEIRVDGAVLEFHGQRFLVPRGGS